MPEINEAFESWFEERKENFDVWGNENDFWVDEEIKNFCKMAYDAGYAQLQQEIKTQGLALQSDMDKTIEQNLALKKEVEKLSVKCEDYHEAMKDYITRFKNYVKAFFE